MKFVKFFKDLSRYFIENSVNDFKMPRRILQILENNMTEAEKDKYRFYIYKCLTSIRKQLTIPEFLKEMKRHE